MRSLISLDDTDNRVSRGTGYRARCLGQLLTETGLAQVEGITRHQLLVDPQIPYTSHNSAACLVVKTNAPEADELIDYCREFLLRESAPGSDAGLCLAPWPAVSPSIRAFGRRAKQKVLTYAEAMALADREGIFLEGLTGDHRGVIGALAAVGLRAGGQDGRFIWLEGLRGVSGVYTAEQLLQTCHIDRIVSIDGVEIPPEARIDVGDWCRPILRDSQAVLLVEAADERTNGHWRVAPREIVKQY